MNFSFCDKVCNKVLTRLVPIPVIFSLAVMGFRVILPVQAVADKADTPMPEFYRGLLDGYYVELVVDWLPDKRVEGEIWTAAHTVTPRELGFVFAKVKGENPLAGQLELEIVGDEVSDKGGTGDAGGENRLGSALLKKELTGNYIEWKGEYKRATGEKVPMMMYRERRPSSELEEPDDERKGPDTSRDEHELPGTGSCEEGVCAPARIVVCVEKKHISEAREYFQWLRFPFEVLCASPSERGCIRDFLCTGETWVLEVDGFSEPYWVQEFENLSFITSARRHRGGAGYDTGIIEMPISSFFSGTVPDHEEAVRKIEEFLHEYFSEALAAGSVTVAMKERTRFNYTIDILGASSSLSLRKPGLLEHHQLSIMMSQPYPYDSPDKFAVYMGLPAARFIEWTNNAQPPSDKFMNINDKGPSVFFEKLVSAFAHRYRAAVWTP